METACAAALVPTTCKGGGQHGGQGHACCISSASLRSVDSVIV